MQFVQIEAPRNTRKHADGSEGVVAMMLDIDAARRQLA